MDTALNLGAPPDAVQAAASALGVVFPAELVAVWAVSNGLELPGGWRFFPVFDGKEARKTSNHIVYENTKGRWEIMDPELVAIAYGDTGNALVLRKSAMSLEPTVFVWDHETRRTKKWSRDLAYVAAKAKARVADIEKRIRRAMKGRP